MSDDDATADAATYAALRRTWSAVDPVPVGLIDRMVAAVAVEDLSREYELLTLVEGEVVAVRSETDTMTLQFSSGLVNVLIHVTAEDDGSSRVDGWIEGTALAVRLLQDETVLDAGAAENGRFALTAVPHGLSRLRIVIRDDSGDLREFETPRFEV